MNINLLRENARKILSRTILAADESTSTIKKRLASIGVESSPEINRQYRQLLFATVGIEQYVSGVILYDETIRQSTDNNVPFPKLLQNKNIAPGIKVDNGTVKVPNSTDTITEGLEGLADRFKEYGVMGATFAKWRAVFTIGDGSPADSTIERNVRDLATYANLSQQADIVPIVEPEVLMDGNHSFEKDQEVTEKVLASLFRKLAETGVDMQGIILKPNMITSGSTHPEQATSQRVSEMTLHILKRTVPANVPGIAFLSGGQSPDMATSHLNEINKLKNSNPDKYPWRITASFGRALQGEALEAWGGKMENVKKAQEVFLNRANKVYNASLGKL